MFEFYHSASYRKRYFAESHSVSASVCHTDDPRLKGSRYRNMFTPCDGDVFSFLTLHFVVVSCGVATTGHLGLGSCRDKQRFCSDKKEPKSSQLATCFLRAKIYYRCFHGALPRTHWRSLQCSPDPLAEFAKRRGAIIENYRESRRVTLTSLLPNIVSTGPSGGVRNRRLSSCLERQNFNGHPGAD